MSTSDFPKDSVSKGSQIAHSNPLRSNFQYLSNIITSPKWNRITIHDKDINSQNSKDVNKKHSYYKKIPQSSIVTPFVPIKNPIFVHDTNQSTNIRSQVKSGIHRGSHMVCNNNTLKNATKIKFQFSDGRHWNQMNESFYKRWFNVRFPLFIDQSPISIQKNDTFVINKSSNQPMKQLPKIKKASTSMKSLSENDDISRNKGFVKLLSFKDKFFNQSLTLPSSSLSIKSPLKQLAKDLRRRISNKKDKNSKFNYYISLNNNGKLIERCLLTRSKWVPVAPECPIIANWFWVPLSSEINFQKSEELGQFVNHFEYHSELSNKMKLFINLLNYCEYTKIDLFSFFPLTVVFQILNKRAYMEQMNGLERCYNDFPKIIENNSNPLVNYYNYFNVNFSKKSGTIQKMSIPSTHYIGKNLWLIKPVNWNRGRCIKLFNSWDDIKSEMNRLKESKQFSIDKSVTTKPHHVINSTSSPKQLPKLEYIIIQKYIEQPLLYMYRKFDIRLWVLFTDNHDVYVFKEGHLKITCDSYNINSNDLFVHLTNYSVQKHNSNFSKISIGNEIPFEHFQKELDNMTYGKINFRRDIYPKIINIVRITALAVKGKLNLNGRKNCFELFGYDFIIDRRCNPFLLEVNTNPGLEESSPLIKMLLPRMIDDALKIVLDSKWMMTGAKKCVKIYQKESSFKVEGYRNDENMWQKVKL